MTGVTMPKQKNSAPTARLTAILAMAIMLTVGIARNGTPPATQPDTSITAVSLVVAAPVFINPQSTEKMSVAACRRGKKVLLCFEAISLLRFRVGRNGH